MIEAVVGVALRAILASVLLGGILAALVLAATRTLALTAATRHALWITALVATAAMPLAGIGVSVLKGAPPPAPRPPRVASGPPAELATTVRPRHDAAALAPSPGSAPRTSRPPATMRETDERAAAATGDRFGFVRWTPRMSRALALGAVVLWAAGALIGLTGLAASVLRVRGLKRRSSPLDGTLADELPWLTDVHAGREIYVRLSYETETPVAIGFKRPVILIPTELATADGLSAIEPLIMHEHAHLRRFDDWTNLLQRVIERLFWFNPVVWLVGRRIALEREIASDDAVVERTGAAHAYATSLWRLVREMRMPEHAVVAPGALLTRKQITVRIEQLLDAKRSRLHRSPAAALLVAAVSAVAVAVVATSAPAVELPPLAESPAPAPGTGAHPTRDAVAIAWHAEPKAPADADATPGIPAHDRRPAQEGSDTRPPAPALHVAPAQPRPVPAATTRVLTRVEHRIVYDHVERSAPPAAPAPPAAKASSAGSADATAGWPGIVLPPEAVAHIRDAAGPVVARTVRDALASVPKQIAQESGNAERRRADVGHPTRQVIAACTACSFRNADLHGIDLHDLAISGDDFGNADLRGADLRGARLSGVSLRGTNLTGADLRGASLSGVELRGANFTGVQLDGIRLTGVSIRYATFGNTPLRSIIANCVGCDFAHMDLHGQDLHGITLSGADLTRADLRNANLSGVQFNGVDLTGANLAGADLTNARFNGCDLTGVDLRSARTTGMMMQGSSAD